MEHKTRVRPKRAVPNEGLTTEEKLIKLIKARTVLNKMIEQLEEQLRKERQKR